MRREMNGAPAGGPDVAEGSHVVANLEAAANEQGERRGRENGHAS